MNIFITKDRQHYRRWMNIIPSFLIPGAGQFLSHRRAAGFIWFGGYLLAVVLVLWLVLSPSTPYSLDSIGLPNLILWIVFLAMVADSFRKPIPRIGFKGWTALVVICLAIVLIPVFFVRQFLVHPFKVSSGAMQPTLMGIMRGADGEQRMGDHFFVNKVIYRFQSPQRGDIVVFRTSGLNHPTVPKNTHYVKRIVGLPNDKVSIRPPYAIVNGQRLTAPPIFTKISEGKDGYSGYFVAGSYPGVPDPFLKTAQDTITLGSDEYLLLGDNSKTSLDGRYFGPVKRSSIIGKAFYIYTPADRKRRLE